jgi:sphinganine-1-phosphate aldolase
MRKTLPKAGRPWETLEHDMDVMRADDADWRRGRLPYYIWYGGDDIFEVQKKSYTMFMQENGVGAGRAFQSLKHMEDDVIDFAADLLRGNSAVGHITSGGSESIFVAMKAARDWARATKPNISRPEFIVPYSAHPTFNRAGEYLDLRIVRIPVAQDWRANPRAMADAISPNTIALAASAPCFPYGVIDPIDEISSCARERGLWMHVDACVGGYSAPFVRELGYPIPDFDFSLPGVISISADLHKYGFCAKGASTVLYCDRDYEKFQPFDFDEWPMGRFTNPNVASTRPGGSIAAAWAVMNYLGRDGYLRLNKRLMIMRDRYIAGVNAIEGLRVRGAPHLLIISFSSEDPGVDIMAVADAMTLRGWYVGRQAVPPGILIGLSLPHEAAIDTYLSDLKAATATVRKTGARAKADLRITY